MGTSRSFALDDAAAPRRRTHVDAGARARAERARTVAPGPPPSDTAVQRDLSRQSTRAGASHARRSRGPIAARGISKLSRTRRGGAANDLRMQDAAARALPSAARCCLTMTVHACVVSPPSKMRGSVGRAARGNVDGERHAAPLGVDEHDGVRAGRD